MFRILRYLNGHWVESIVGPLFKFFEACLELTVPVLVADMIDGGIKNGDEAYVLRIGFIVVLFGFLGFACSLVAQFFAARASMAFGTALRNDLYRHINTFSAEELDKFGVASLITRLNSDVISTQTGINLIIRILLRSPFIVVGAVVAAFMINFSLAMIFMVAVPAVSAAVYFIIKKLFPLYDKTQNHIDKITLKTRENLTGVRVVRAFAAQEFENAEFLSETNRLFSTQLTAGKTSALLNPLSYAIINLGVAAIILCGGFSVDLGIISQGQVVALINYMSQALFALLAIANLVVVITKAFTSAERINEVFDTKPKITYNGEKNIGNIENITFSGVSYKYFGASKNAVENISFTVKKGTTVGIIGGTGAGKSTLSLLLTRQADPSEGEVLINDINLKEYSFSTIIDKISIVPQKPDIFSGTIRENLTWRKKDASDEELFTAIKTAQAEDFIKGNLDAPVKKSGSNFSGGQKQRLSIARALVGDSDVLIFDDSSSALDYATDARLRKAVKALKDKTVFIISQRVFAVKNADLILVFHDGKLVGKGIHEDLIKSCSVYEEICRSQSMSEV